MKMRYWLGAILLWCGLATVAGAEEADRVKISMLVSGTIEVDAEGRVSRHTLDQSELLPPEVVELLGKAVPKWRFEPVLVDGQAVRAQTDMSVRVVAKRLDEKSYTVEVGGASFGAKSRDRATIVASKQMAPPRYPPQAARDGATGTVYLLVKVGRSGQVEDVIAEQVNLTGAHTDGQQRRMFAKAAIAQARSWEFQPPTKGKDVDAPFWTLSGPGIFALGTKPPYGRWDRHVPGPRHQAPWKTQDEGVAFSPDTVPEGAAHQAGSGFKLLTAPGG